YPVQVVRSSELSDGDRRSVWDIFARNMHDMYVQSSMGWDPETKKAQLFHTDSRFILLRRPEPTASADGTESLTLASFAMFRFDTEGGDRVVYCYELQIGHDCRRGGLGRALMGMLYDIAKRCDMHKVMLTVFQMNEPAISFYKSVGFQLDPISPGYEDDSEWIEEDEDYYIMSRTV
ncbi:acyl-CoA N-acyltransferase, partial [Vararia minispora EC-137]